MIGNFFRRLFCAHDYHVWSWGSRWDVLSQVQIGSYIYVICAKCGKSKQVNFTIDLDAHGVEDWMVKKGYWEKLENRKSKNVTKGW